MTATTVGNHYQQRNIAILQRIQDGDTSAHEDLWYANKGLVAHIAYRYMPYLEKRRHLDLDDLIQSGYLGIRAAAEKYDPIGTASFSTYAVYYIKTEICRTLGISRYKSDAADTAISLDTPLETGEADGATLGDLIATGDQSDQIEARELQEVVRDAVNRIPRDNVRRVVVSYFWHGKDSGQIAAQSGGLGRSVTRCLHKGYSLLRSDASLRKWASDYGYAV